MYEVNPITGLVAAMMEMIPWFRCYEWYVNTLTTVEKVRDEQNNWHRILTEAPQDARDVYYQLDGWAEFDIGNTPGFNGDAKAALSTIKAKALLIGVEPDQLVRRDEIQFARSAIPGASYVGISSLSGHVAYLNDPKAVETLNREIAKFLLVGQIISERYGKRIASA